MLSRRSLIGVGLTPAAAGAAGANLWPRTDGYLEKVARQRQLLPGDQDTQEPVRPAALAVNDQNSQTRRFRLFTLFFTKEAEKDNCRDQMRFLAGIAVFVGDKTDPSRWIRVGRSFQRFALQTTAVGAPAAHVNQPVEAPSFQPDFARWLEMPNARPDPVTRLVRAPAMPISLRRPVGAARA